MCHIDKLIIITFDSTRAYKMKLLFGAIQTWTAEKLLNFRLAYSCYSVNHSLIRTRLQPLLKALLFMDSRVFVTVNSAQLGV